MAFYKNAIELIEDLEKNEPRKIRVYNLGENLGMDFAFYGHFLALKRFFPKITIELYRSNIDETNTIGFENWKGKAKLPVDDIKMEIVKQRYPDGNDWVKKLVNNPNDIFSKEFLDATSCDYVWLIGMGTCESMKEYLKPKIGGIESDVVLDALEKHAEKISFNPLHNKEIDISKYSVEIKPWYRTLAEYLVDDLEEYPFTFIDTPFSLQCRDSFRDYIRISLRWPDHVRWYYSIDRQYEILFESFKKIKSVGKQVKVVYSLKDGEVGNNFNRGQTIDKLLKVKSLCDDMILTYSWPSNPYFGRPSEEQELMKLKSAGFNKIMKVDVWDDLLLSSACKVVLSDPGGFMEVLHLIRNDKDTLLMFPISAGHLCTYLTLNKDRKPVYCKVNPLLLKQAYNIQATLSPLDDPEGYRTLYWNIDFQNQYWKIGENLHGDDLIYFEAAQQNVFKQMYNQTKDDLIDEVVKQYIK